jgi:hypothetical protein
MKFSTAFTFATAAGLASAQSLSLSTQCTNSLKGVLGSPEAACLNPSALLQFFVTDQQPVPTTVNNWLTGLCALGTCSNDTLAAVVANVTAGCSSDIGSTGASVPATLTSLVQQFYPTARQIACLKDDAANQLCVTETLNNLETVAGKLTASDLNFANIFNTLNKIIGGAKNLACTSCTKAAFALAATSQVPFLSQAVDGVDALCGDGFVEGGKDLSTDGVSQTAVNEVFVAEKQGSATTIAFSKTGAVLLAVMTAFFFA